MSFFTASGANAAKCLRIKDNKEFELLFLSANVFGDIPEIKGNSLDKIPSKDATHLVLYSDNEEIAARIIDQSMDQIYATYAPWLPNTVSLFTYHLDKVNRRLKEYITFFENKVTVLYNEYLCTEITS